MTNHYHGHRDRLRKRLLEAPQSLADYEMLELLLGYVLLRRDTKPIAKEMLAQFGTLHSVMQQPASKLREVEGVGPGVENLWFLLQELSARVAESPILHKEVLASPESVAHMAKKRLGKLQHEEMWVAYVNNQNKLLSWERANKGTVDATSIFPRDIMERTLLLKASGFILVHNHPGGDATPSTADITLTERLKRAAQPLCIRFVDHIIVTESGFSSVMHNTLL